MKRLAGWLWLAVALGAGQLGWTWLSRHDADVRMSRRAAGRFSTLPASRSGSGVRIAQFYARSGEMVEGERNLVCYGVENAKLLRLDPAVETVSPALIRCFWIEPQQDTTYRLTAEGFDGTRDEAAFTVRVRPAPPAFRFIDVSDRQIPRGEVLTVCYGVDHASGVRLNPLGWNLPAVAKNCIRFYPKATYT